MMIWESQEASFYDRGGGLDERPTRLNDKNTSAYSSIDTEFGKGMRGVGRISYDRSTADFSSYKPVQIFQLEDRPRKIVTINHELGKNIIGIQFQDHIAIYQLSIHNEIEGERNTEHFNLKKLEEFKSNESKPIIAFGLNAASSISFGGQKMFSYAVSYAEESKFHFVPLPSQPDSTTIKTNESAGVLQMEGHTGSIRGMCFDGERGELLASIGDDSLCIIWDIVNCVQVSRLILPTPAVECLWHKGDPYKLLIIEENGCIRMYNALKQCVIITLNTLSTPVYSADWSVRDSELVGIGTNKGVILINLSKLNSEPGRRIDTQGGATHFLKFSTSDSDQFVSGSMAPKPELRNHQKNFRNVVWTHKVDSLQGLSWVYGEPFVMALVGKQLCFYESSTR